MPSRSGGLSAPGRILLISCYELGRPPLGIAGPAAQLARHGFRPALLDLSQCALDQEAVRAAGLIGISVPMHTALVLGVEAARHIRALNPAAHLCFFGSYAALNRAHLAAHVADTVLGPEPAAALLRLAQRLDGAATDLAPPPDRDAGAAHGLARPQFAAPRREGLPELSRYAKLAVGGEERLSGTVEATRGCKYLCRHCPLPPVYDGRFFAVPQEIVLEDVAALVAAGAAHISFADADFLNGPTHALRVARALHRHHPGLTFDFTTRIAHLIAHRALLPELAACGALFVVSAAESLNDEVLLALDKGHRAADVPRALDLTREVGLTLRPTFVPFTPWETLESYLALLDFVQREDLLRQVDAVQLTIRLLVPPGSALLGTPAFEPVRGELHAETFTWDWRHADPRMDALQQELTRLVAAAAESGEAGEATFLRIREAAHAAAGRVAPPLELPLADAALAPPRMTEVWFC
ncbi:MAG: radical SAM protein [Candidatus Lambdaproteobacteria bacterium]|nr:radical SAM protein [Candidatus Lambdaproteobacteria bacterium]